jgi:hypothetical protein
MLFCISGRTNIYTQSTHEDSTKSARKSIISIGLGMGGMVPAGDLKDRFGKALDLSLQGEYITRSNWVLSSELIYFFGDDVKEDVLAPFRTSTGVILGDDNQIADVFMRHRGMYAGAGFGKLVPIKNGSRSGIKFTLHGGVYQHFIKFTDERNSVAQIRDGRYKGYDRLSRGFALHESVGYTHLSHDKRLNFQCLFDFMQGFTSEVRAVNFDTGTSSLSSRLDLIFGVRFVWNLPFYRGGSDETLYY